MKSLIPLLLSLITLTAALPADDPIDAILSALDLQGLAGKGTPPLPTTIHSPECANLNGGTYVCCESTLNGGFPLVKELSALADYPLTDNTINGLINCEQLGSGDTCDPGTKLCCGTIALLPLAALYCQQAE